MVVWTSAVSKNIKNVKSLIEKISVKVEFSDRVFHSAVNVTLHWESEMSFI